MSDPGPLVNCPYKGLEPYTERDAAVFAGRGEDIARVISNLYASSLIILYGESGVGKTSLLWAGVVPQLKKDVPELKKKKKRVAVVVFREWQSKDFQRRLRETVLLALLETINARLLKPGSPPLDLERLKSALNRTLAENSAERNGNGLPALADERSPLQNINDLPLDRFLILCADAIQGRIFFIIDQFEEYFLYHPLSETDNDFDEQLACAVNSPDVPVSFLISLREEGLSKLDRLLGRIPRLLSNMLRIEHLSQTGAHAAIEEPLTKTPEVEIDDNLIPELFKQLDPDLVGFDESNRPKPLTSKGDESRVNGSFLQIVLTRLWGEEIAKGAKRLTLHKFQELGGANKIEGDYFDDVMGFQLGKAVLARNAAATENEISDIRDSAADLFKFLVTVIGSKFAPAVGDLAGLMHRTPDLAFDTPQCRQRRLEKVHQTLEILGDIRVVRLVDGSANIAARRYEIAHDVLGSAIRRWRERHETDKARREAEREKQEAEARARILEEKRQLEEKNRRLAEGFAKEQELQAKNACRMANRFRRLFVVAAGLCIVAVGLLAWAINSTVRLKHNTVRLKDSTARLKEMFKNMQRQLHMDSMVSFNTGDRLMQLDQWSEGMLHLAHACKCDPQNAVAAERFFYELLNHRSQARRIPVSSISSQGLVFHAVMSADDKEVLIAGSDGARVYDVEHGNVIGPFVCPGTVYTAVFGRDGSHILTASADGTARLWETASGKQLLSFQHGGPVLSAVFSPDENRILTASADNTARLWETASGAQLLPFQHGGPVLSAVFTPDGTRILTASKDSTAVLWDANTGVLLQTFRHKGPVLHAAFIAEGKVVLTASEDGTAKLWNATTGAVIQSFPHAGPVVNILFNPKSGGILTASEDKTAKLWNAETGALIYSFEHADKLSDTAFSPDGNRIITASADKTVRLWDYKTGKLLGSLQHAGRVSSAVFTSDGQKILTVSNGGTVKLWHADLAEFRPSFQHLSGPEFKVVLTGSFSPDNKFIVTGSEDNTAELWDAETGQPLHAFSHEHKVFKTLFAPEGDKILTVSGDNGAKGGDSTVTLWDLKTHSLLCAIPIHGALFDAEFSLDGRQILTASGGNAIIWDMTGKQVRQLPHRRDVYRVMTNTKGDRILTCSADGTAMLWDTSSGKAIQSFPHGGAVLNAVFSPDSNYILTVGEDKTAKLWAIRTGKMLHSFPHDSFVTNAVFSKNGKYILTISNEGEVDLWEAENGIWETDKITHKRLPRAVKVQTAVFSPDDQSQNILTAGGDNIARLWDRENTELLSAFVHDAPVTDAAFSNDGGRILTVCGSGAELWDANTPELIYKELKPKDKTDERLSTEIKKLAEFVTGCSMSEEGLAVALSDKERRAKVAELQAQATNIGSEPNQQFFQWFLGDDNGLEIFPNSKRRINEWDGKNKAVGSESNQPFFQWFLSDDNRLTIFPDSNRRINEWGGKNKNDR